MLFSIAKENILFNSNKQPFNWIFDTKFAIGEMQRMARKYRVGMIVSMNGVQTVPSDSDTSNEPKEPSMQSESIQSGSVYRYLESNSDLPMPSGLTPPETLPVDNNETNTPEATSVDYELPASVFNLCFDSQTV